MGPRIRAAFWGAARVADGDQQHGVVSVQEADQRHSPVTLFVGKIDPPLKKESDVYVASRF